jgi:hypothetical protein
MPQTRPDSLLQRKWNMRSGTWNVTWKPVQGGLSNKMDFQEMGCGNMDWIGLAQYRGWCRGLVTAVIQLRIP